MFIMKRMADSRAKRMLQLVQDQNKNKPDSDNNGDNNEDVSCKSSESEPYSEDSCVDPTYRPEQSQKNRTLNWILTEDFFSKKSDANKKKSPKDTRSYHSRANINKSLLLDGLDNNFLENREKNLSSTESSIVESSCTSIDIPLFKPISVTQKKIELEDAPTSTEFQENVLENVTNITQLINPEPSTSGTQIPKISSRNSTHRFIEEALNKQKKKRTTCKFCRISVTNFERHLCRHHSEEREVQDYLKFPKNTKDGKQMRRNILALLRYEVKFEEFVQKEEVDSEKLPCVHCKRLIAVKYLRRHYKKCIIKPINETGRPVRHQAASQTLVAFASDVANTTATLRVKREVFTRMASDEIGFVARKDTLIRHFGEFYLKKHKRAQISLPCSNKMRECARLLIEMRRRIGNQELSFCQMLNPTLFDNVVLAAKAISGYNEVSKNYKAPSLALHLGTTLQKTCEITTHLLLKKSPEFKCNNLEDKLKEIKRFRYLVEKQWNYEVSSLALKDLAEKKWNAPVMLPLTKDIIKFRDYILETAEKNVALLRKNRTDTKAYKKLVDASLALTILFNRRRIGDVQYVEIDSYFRNYTANNQTEYMEQLTESEKTLTSSYKRVVAGGKGSRAIVILFAPNVQEYINLLLEIRRESGIVPNQNRYLFAYPGVTDQWVRGDVVIKNFAKACKIEHPEAMTSNRLRKQIATLMQIINLDKNEYSQFARFMGHTEKTHQEFYEITQDAYQTAKVAKLLSLFDKGEGVEYKGKTLSDIDINPNNLLVDADDNSENGEDPPEEKTTQNSTVNNNKEEEEEEGECEAPIKKKSNRIRWTPQQKKLVSSHFKTHIRKKQAPKKNECEDLISQNKKILNNLDWVRVKTFVYNLYTKAK